MAPYYMNKSKSKNSKYQNIFIVGMPWQRSASNKQISVNENDIDSLSRTFPESNVTLAPFHVTCKTNGNVNIYSNIYNFFETRPSEFTKSLKRLAYTKKFNLDITDCETNSQIEDNLNSCVIDMHEDMISEDIFKHEKDNKEELLEFYLKLPREVFPPAKAISLNPNPIIHEFCYLTDVPDHCQWILDLEFGRRRYPSSTPIPRYNVTLNNITCWSAPDFIHPVFEKCSVSFKRTLLFYYDYIYSIWYKGYLQVYSDNSLVNFKSWMSIPGYAYGMNWP